jgi:hypothetical protein
VTLVAVVSGCAVGNKYSYRDVVASLPATNGGSVAVATHDQREYILSGSKQPNFVGIQRGGFGNPFDVTNRHNEPLSTSYSAAACNSLKASGTSCSVVETIPLEQSNSVVQKLTRSGQDMGLLFTLREWKTDALLSTALIYDVTLSVISRDGTVLATKAINGRDNLDGSFWNGPRHARKATPVAFKSKLEALLGSREIQGVLASNRSTHHNTSYAAKAPETSFNAATPPQRIADKRAIDETPTQSETARDSQENSTAPCTVAKVLEMQRKGLSEAEIEMSCQ